MEPEQDVKSGIISIKHDYFHQNEILTRDTGMRQGHETNLVKEMV